MRFSGTKKQNQWAISIMHADKIMDSQLIIDHRGNLPEYADELGNFYKLSASEKHDVAMSAVNAVEQISKQFTG